MQMRCPTAQRLPGSRPHLFEFPWTPSSYKRPSGVAIPPGLALCSRLPQRLTALPSTDTPCIASSGQQGMPLRASWALLGWAAGSDALEGGGAPPPPLQGAQPMPSHCPPDAKCQAQWHL